MSITALVGGILLALLAGAAMVDTAYAPGTQESGSPNATPPNNEPESSGPGGEGSTPSNPPAPNVTIPGDDQPSTNDADLPEVEVDTYPELAAALVSLYGPDVDVDATSIISSNDTLAEARLDAQAMGVELPLTPEQTEATQEKFDELSGKIIEETVHILVDAAGASYGSWSEATFDAVGISIDTTVYQNHSIDFIHKDVFAYPTIRIEGEDRQRFHAQKVAQHIQHIELARRFCEKIYIENSNLIASSYNYYMWAEYHVDSGGFHQGIDFKPNGGLKSPITGVIYDIRQPNSTGSVSCFCITNGTITFVFFHLRVDDRYLIFDGEGNISRPKSLVEEVTDSDTQCSKYINEGDRIGTESNYGAAQHTHVEIQNGEKSTGSFPHTSATSSMSGAMNMFVQLRAIFGW